MRVAGTTDTGCGYAFNYFMTTIYVSGSSKIQTLLLSNVAEISPQGFKFCNSVEKYQLLLDGNNVWILLEPFTYLL